jgi:uncharacterized protein YlzI (FlbEa/FlbD family)
MKLIHLHRSTGGEINLTVDDIHRISEEPAGQCTLFLSDGTTVQTEESVEQVTKMVEEAK